MQACNLNPNLKINFFNEIFRGFSFQYSNAYFPSYFQMAGSEKSRAATRNNIVYEIDSFKVHILGIVHMEVS